MSAIAYRLERTNSSTARSYIDSDVLILFTVGVIGIGGEPWNFA
jgi:hypothetical protein